jgi:hypothetical protein
LPRLAGGNASSSSLSLSSSSCLDFLPASKAGSEGEHAGKLQPAATSSWHAGMRRQAGTHQSQQARCRACE